MKIEMLNPKVLEPSAYNPRKITAEEMANLRRSIREFGLVEAILVQTPGNRIISGHQRREAAMAEGLERVPVHRLKISDAKAKALNLAMNRIGGEWDDEKLASLLRSLDGLERELTGFGEDEIAKLLGDALDGRSIEEMAVKPAPKIIWYLIAIPLERFGQVQEHVAALEAAAEISVQASREK